MNSWNFTGNLGGDAETKFLPNGDAIVNFSVAVKAGYGDKAVTTWVRCAMFGKRGEAVSQYLLKGSLVGVVGEAQLRPWTDKDGNKQSSLEVRVADLTLLGGNPNRNPDSLHPGHGDRPDPAPRQQTSKPAPNFSDMDDDIPF